MVAGPASTESAFGCVHHPGLPVNAFGLTRLDYEGRSRYGGVVRSRVDAGLSP
jgi:hypothetical protein